MKISYKFVNNEITEVEVPDDIGTFILDSRRMEHNAEERQRYHCPYSTDALTYEGLEYADPTDLNQTLTATEDRKKLHEALRHLSGTQRRRLLMLADGLSLREIARREGVDIKTLRESIEGARKKFLKFF